VCPSRETHHFDNREYFYHWRRFFYDRGRSIYLPDLHWWELLRRFHLYDRGPVPSHYLHWWDLYLDRWFYLDRLGHGDSSSTYTRNPGTGYHPASRET